MASPDRPRVAARRIADVASPLPGAGRPGARALARVRARTRPSPPSWCCSRAPTDDLVDELIARLGAVVLTVSAAHALEGHAAVSWAADHAAELGVDPARIAVVGDRSGAAVAERVAELAVEEGWPPLRHVALIWPHDDPAAALDGLARALAVPDPQSRSAR